MAPEKVTKMVVDVDLKCSDCYKKVKKVMSKIPEIRDQEYDVEKNKVKITVVCCSPERIRDKLCYKGGNSIQKVDIVPDKPKEPAAKPKSKPKEPEKPKDDDKPKNDDKPKDNDKPDPSPKQEVARMVYEAPVQGYPQMYPPSYPMVGYGYQGYWGDRGMPVTQPEPSGYYVYNDYFSEENPQGCSVM
ncbi:putative heavy metal-associated domain superfamily [Helianthus debilis subsp. tardiflorus]